MRERVLFIAGATGVVGRAVVEQADARKAVIVPHVRPKRAAAGPVDPRAAVLDLGDEDALAEVLACCTTVVQLIGTMRKRFKTGDTYETSDVGTTAQLVAAAKRAGIDHFVLLSSVGAGNPLGAYLKAKARAEALVRDSGLPFTIFRPSMLIGPGRGFAAAEPLAKLLRLETYAPIRVEALAAALLHVALAHAPLGATLEGRSLWALVREATAR
ncbi:MAG: SDR family oxidoreductase [Myxococcales bacterium]|jgi:nucleoside-diphosphate-sugar epimerase